MTEQDPWTSDRMLERIVALVREKRGEEVVALDVRHLVDYMDFLVLASARSDRQNRSIADHLLREMGRSGVGVLSMAGQDAAAWICVDFVDVVVHLFTPETRMHYDLELLWADAPRVELPQPASSSSPASS